MANSPDGKGVLLFGGHNDVTMVDTILELRAGANSWNFLNITLQERRDEHTVIPIP